MHLYSETARGTVALSLSVCEGLQLGNRGRSSALGSALCSLGTSCCDVPQPQEKLPSHTHTRLSPNLGPGTPGGANIHVKASSLSSHGKRDYPALSLVRLRSSIGDITWSSPPPRLPCCAGAWQWKAEVIMGDTWGTCCDKSQSLFDDRWPQWRMKLIITVLLLTIASMGTQCSKSLRN